MATQLTEHDISTATPPEANREIHEQLGRKYEAGFVTDIESESLPRAWTRTPSAPCRPRRKSRSG